MSKLPVVFCVLFLACASHGSSIFSPVLSSISKVKNEVENTVGTAIASIEAAAEEGLGELKALAANVATDAESTVNNLQNGVESIISNTESKVNSLVSQVTSVSTNKCSNILNTFRTTGIQVVAEATSCVTDKLKTAYGYITNFASTVKKLVLELRNVLSVTTDCASGVDSFSEAGSAFLCVNKQLARATLLSASSIVSITSDVAKISNLIVNLRVDIPTCVVADVLSVLTNQAKAVVGNVQTCVANLIS